MDFSVIEFFLIFVVLPCAIALGAGYYVDRVQGGK